MARDAVGSWQLAVGSWQLAGRPDLLFTVNRQPSTVNLFLHSRLTTHRSLSQLALQHLVELRRVGLAVGGFHHLANEEAEELVLARAILGELRRIGRHH